MANTILIKRKTTTGAPSLAQLSIGEMCLVLPDNALYWKKDETTIVGPIHMSNYYLNLLAEKESLSNKAITMNGNTGSDTVYLTAKAIFDWAASKTEVQTNTQNIANLQAAQYSGVKTYLTLASLPATGTVQTSYKVTNDPTIANNGYYTWNGTTYVKELNPNLAQTVLETNTADPVSGKAVYEALAASPIFKAVEIVNPVDIATKTNFNSSIKALYPLVTLAANERIIVYFFSQSGAKYQLGLGIYNTSTTAFTQLSPTTGRTYDWNKVVPIYDNAGTNIIAYAYASLANYIGTAANYGQGNARLPYLLSPCYDIYKQPLILEYLNNLEHKKLKAELDSNKVITVWGDSITWGSASSTANNCYTGILRSLITSNGYLDKVINCGVGGENFHNVLVRKGTFGFYFSDDVVLPQLASQTVEVQRVTGYINNKKFRNTFFGANSYFNLLAQGENGRDNLGTEFATVNPITVAGIKCRMTYVGNAENAVIYLAPLTDQPSTTLIKSGTFLYPNGNKFKKSAVVLSLGTNDGFTVSTGGVVDAQLSADRYIEMTELAIKESNSDFIICSPYAGTALAQLGVSGLQVLENKLTQKYGPRHFNWRKYLIDYGLKDAGITPTTADNNAIAIGQVPPSLLSDGLHPNDAGHLVLGTKLFQIMRDLGMLNL